MSILQKILRLFFISLIFSISVLAANKPIEQNKNQLKVDQSKFESVADEAGQTNDVKSLKPSMNNSKSASVSPGVSVGTTWYDQQHNGTVGRMIDHGPHSGGTGDPTIHFGWMALPADFFGSRHFAYNHYNANTGTLYAQQAIQPGDEYAGYVGIDAISSDYVCIGGHNDQGGGNQSHFYYDNFIPWPTFYQNSRVTDSVAGYGGTTGQSVIWPKFRYQEGTQDVTHVIAQISAAAPADPQAIYYFRKIGTNETGVWDYPPYVIDTIFDLSHDIAASRNSDKIALVWTANLNYDNTGVQLPPGVCDTCSGASPVHVQWDNDIYCQVSDDQGATWNPRVNVTLNRHGEAGFRPYTDLSCLIDSQDELHILWSGVVWPEDPVGVGWGWNCRLQHWSENTPFIRTVSNADWVQTVCTPGSWNINISKMQVSECDGKIYALWTQFNDIPNGIEDDCAARADGGSGDVTGSANGELFVAVSSDGGLNWDQPRNLTNSYTPGCDPNNGGIDCQSDMWPSMARYGRQVLAGEDWSVASIVDPSGSYSGDYFLDVQYINDYDAGSIVKNEGTWQLSDVRWFRMACVEPTPAPGPMWMNPISIGDPTWSKPGLQLDVDVTIENLGNVALTYSITLEEDNGTAGWLNYSGFSGTIPAGLSNIEVGTIHLNNGGVEITNGVYTGRLIFTGNSPTSPDTFMVSFIVADTIIPPVFDTIETACLALIVGNNGNTGNMGRGNVNLDYNAFGSDCDTTADVYLNDGSPVVLWQNGSDTAAYWSIFGDNWLDPHGFRPLGGESLSPSNGSYRTYSTGTFVTGDSTVAFEKIIYTPTHIDSCTFIIQKLKVWDYNGSGNLPPLRIGEIVDWDIPSDSNAYNGSGFDFSRNLIYQVGGEFDNDDTLDNGLIDPNGNDCVDSDRRFGGIAMYKSFLNGTEYQTVPYCAYTDRNDSFVYPTGNFIPGELYERMDNSGITVENEVIDLHTVMCYEPALSLGASDIYEIYTVIATVQDGTVADLQATIDAGFAFIEDGGYPPPCCILRGDVDGDGEINIADLVYWVYCSFGGGVGCFDACPEVWDVDNSGFIDIADLVYLVEYMFGGGPAPVPCY